MGCCHQHGMSGTQAQGEIEAEYSAYTEITEEMNMNHQATNATMHNQNQVTQHQDIMLQQMQVGQRANQQQNWNNENNTWSNNNDNRGGH